MKICNIEVFKDIVSNVNKEVYDIFVENNLIDKMYEFVYCNTLMSVDLLDFLHFIKESKIVKIINNNTKTYNNLVANQMLFIDYNSESLNEFKIKLNKYIKEYNLENCDLLIGCYVYKQDDLVILFNKNEIKYDFNDFKELLEKYDLIDELDIF